MKHIPGFALLRRSLGSWLGLLLLVIASCRSPQPASPAEVPQGEPVDLRAPPAEHEPDPSISSQEAEAPRARLIVDHLESLIGAALAGEDLPPGACFELPTTRGELLVQVRGDGFPQGRLDALASLLKIDVILQGCGPDEGLTLGLFQTRAGVSIVGLGNQIRQQSRPGTGLASNEITAVATPAVEALENGTAWPRVLGDAECVEVLGSIERCRQTFQEIPNRSTVDRYERLLSRCQTDPTYALDVVGLWLRDGSGASFQALARFTVSDQGRLTLLPPIMVGAAPQQ